MPDNSGFFPTIDAETGQETSTPIEAVASQYAKKKVKFRAGDRIPVKLNGVEGTIPAEQYDEALAQGAEPWFDPNGRAKALVAEIARTATLGGSDYTSIGAAKLGAMMRGEDVNKAGEDAKKTLSALQEDHPGMDALGTGVGILLPTGVEGLAGKIGKAAGLFQDSAEAAQAVKAAHGVEEAAQASQTAARAEAASGRYIGSGLEKVAKWVDPYQTIAAAGKLVESPLSKVLGPTLGRVGGMAAEGGLIGLASGLDESEIGDAPTTGEALWANTAQGALFGGTLGLVAAGGEKILTGAGRLADRLQEAAAGGSRRDYVDAGKRWGWGGLGHFDLEMGATPTETAHEGLQRVRTHAGNFARELDGVVADADSRFQGVSAKDVYREGEAAAAEAAEKMNMIGGDGGKLRDGILKDLKEHLGFRDMPAPPAEIAADAEEKIYNAKRMQEGLPSEKELKPSKPVSDAEVSKLSKSIAAEYSPHDFAKELQSEIRAARAEGNEAKYNEALAKVGNIKPAYAEKLEEMATKAAHERYAAESLAYDKVNSRLESLHGEARAAVDAQRSRNAFEHAIHSRAAKDYNDNLKVSLAHVREFRTALDKRIPWNRSKDAMLNAAVETKHKVRAALENKIEKAMDGVTKNKDAEVLGKYLHTKARYGMAKDLERMYERSTGAEAKSFGHIMGGGFHNLPYAVAGVALGHPVAGVATAIGGHLVKKYAARGAAFLLHKAAKIAEMKALRAEMQIAAERAAKSTLTGEATNFAKVKIPLMSPHQTRVTAAEAMKTVSKMAGFKAVESRLASMDAYTPVVAPHAAQQYELTARRAVNFLLGQIPPSVKMKLQSGQDIGPDDLTAAESHNFLHAIAAVQDPGVTYDALSRGQLNSITAAGFKAAFPSQAAIINANLKRQRQADKTQFSMISPGKKFSIGLLSGDPNPGLTVKLQQGLIQASVSQTTGKGVSHATFNRSDGVMSQMMSTQTQLAEAGPPGRRGRSKSGSSFGL